MPPGASDAMPATIASQRCGDGKKWLRCSST
jgi:hypothetical protein